MRRAAILVSWIVLAASATLWLLHEAPAPPVAPDDPTAARGSNATAARIGDAPADSDRVTLPAQPNATTDEPAPAAPTAEMITNRLPVRVLDAATGTPVRGATVEVYDLTAGAVLEQLRDGSSGTPPGGHYERATTDADGLTVVARPRLHLRFVAELDGMRDERSVDHRQDLAALELHLEPDPPLSVRVRDGAGRPVPQAAVILARTDLQPREFRAATTDADGDAVFRHVQTLRRDGAGWHVTFGFPVADPPVVPLPADLATPIDLTLTARGSLRVRVRDGDSGRAPAMAGLELLIHARSGGDRWSGPPWGLIHLRPDGDHLLPTVGLGLRFEIELRRRDAAEVLARIAVDGPNRAGQEVVCELRHAPDPPREITGRLVLRDGTPWPMAEVSATLVREDPSRWLAAPLTFTGAAPGRFRLLLEVPAKRHGDNVCLLTAPHPRQRGQATGRLVFDAVPATGLEVGDVVLDLGPLLCSGTVRDDAGRPVPGAVVLLERPGPGGDREEWTRLGDHAAAPTDQTGHFTLRLQPGHSLPDGPLRLHAYAIGHPDEHQPVTPGSRDLLVTLATPGSLMARLELDPALPATDVRAQLESADGAATIPLPVGEDGVLGHPELRPGTWSLTIRRAGLDGGFTAPPAVRVDGLSVLAGRRCDDPRLQAIEVAAAHPTVAVTVVDEQGLPIAAARARPLGAPPGHAVTAGADGTCRPRCRSLPADLVVTAPGYRPSRAEAVQDRARVTLRRGLPVQLTTAAPTRGAAPHFELGLRIRRVGDGTLADSHAFDRVTFDPAGAVTLVLPGPGTYELVAVVLVPRPDGEPREQPVELASPLRLVALESAAVQTFAVAVPPAAVAAAVATAQGAGR